LSDQSGSYSALIDQLFPRQPENDQAATEARAREAESIFPIPASGMFVGAGLETGILLNETRLAYVNGLWLSTIFAAVTAISRHLAGFLWENGETGAISMPFPELTMRAEAIGHIGSYERAKFDELHVLQTNYTRFKGNSPMIAWLEEAGTRGIGLNELLQDDARMALTLAGEYFSRRGR
jgi:hypothetical protein